MTDLPRKRLMRRNLWTKSPRWLSTTTILEKVNLINHFVEILEKTEETERRGVGHMQRKEEEEADLVKEKGQIENEMLSMAQGMK